MHGKFDRRARISGDLQRTPDMPQNVVIPKGKSIIPLAWDPAPAGPSQGLLDLNKSFMFDGSVSKIHVFLDLDVYSSSRTIKRKESCTGTRDEKLSCYKDKRNNDIEQIRMELN